MNPAKELEDHILTLCWSLWTELGVRGVVQHHRDWSVDLEALIIATAALAESDPRLRDESLDCLLKLSPYLSVARLKNILAATAPDVEVAFGPYAATFNSASKTHVKLPATKNARRYRFSRANKSSPFPLLGPAKTSLRLRAMFGVGAKAEVLGLMLAVDNRQWSALELSSRARFVKLVVTVALRDLENAGTVSIIKVGNRNSYRLKEPKALHDLVGSSAKQVVPWPEVFDFLLQAHALLAGSATRGEIAVAVDANKLLDEHRDRMEMLHLAWDKPELEQERWWAGFVDWVLIAANQLADGKPTSALLVR
jgi:hypothetical protein